MAFTATLLYETDGIAFWGLTATADGDTGGLITHHFDRVPEVAMITPWSDEFYISRWYISNLTQYLVGVTKIVAVGSGTPGRQAGLLLMDQTFRPSGK